MSIILKVVIHAPVLKLSRVNVIFISINYIFTCESATWAQPFGKARVAIDPHWISMETKGR